MLFRRIVLSALLIGVLSILGTFLVLQKGVLQRQEANQDPAMVVLDRNAFDLSQFAGGVQYLRYGLSQG